MANETEKERETRERTEREKDRAADHQRELAKDKAEAQEALSTGGRPHFRDKDAQRRAARAAAHDPFGPAPEIKFVTPFDDPEGLITPPLADPIANSTGLVIPPAVLDESLLPDEPTPMLMGEPMPSLATLSGVQQERVEVLTGKRLQREEGNLVPKREPRPDQELPGSRPGRPIINPRPPQPGQLPATS